MHTMWKGAISFGLVNIPVRMFAATEDKDVRFRYLHKECHTPIQYKRVCPHCNRPVDNSELVKGYEYEPGRFVMVSEEEFASLMHEKNKAVEILDFVNLQEIDPIYFDKSYYLSPQETGEKAYALLRQAMTDTGKAAVAKMTMREKTSLAVLRVYEDLLVLETIFYPDEVRNRAQVPSVPSQMALNEKERTMAMQLVENLSTPFEPEKYTDEYREALLSLIEKKKTGQEVKTAPAEPQGQIIDLMEALKASVEATDQKKKVGQKTQTANPSGKAPDKKTRRPKTGHVVS